MHVRRQRLVTFRPHEVRHACLQGGMQEQELRMHGEQELNKCIHRHIYRRHVTAPVATTYGLS